MKEAKKAIADAIENVKHNEAFELAKEHFPALKNQLIPLHGKFNALEKRFRAGAMDMEKYNTQVADVVYTLLQTISSSEGKAPASANRVLRLIAFKTEFLNRVIGEFSRSKWVLFGSLAFVLIVGVVSAIFISSIMPTSLGKTVLIVTLISFFTLVISSLGFLSAQIKQFQGTKSFLKFEEYSSND